LTEDALGTSEPIAELEAPPPPPPRPAPPPSPLADELARACLLLCALTCGLTAALMAGLLPALPARPVASAVFFVLALAAAAAQRAPVHWLRPALGGLLGAVTLGVAINAWVVGWGLAAPGLPALGLMVCLLAAVCGWRAGVALALLAAATVIGIALMDLPDAVTLPSDALRAGVALVAIACGLSAGVLVSQAMARSMRAAHEREQRFSSLLALAADAYWELDQGYRLVAVTPHGAGALRPLTAAGGLGTVPWELPEFRCDPETLDELQADLDHRQAFRDLDVRWRSRSGRERAWRISGEPRFDERGVFTGYWGVARDVTAVVAAHAALAATETRYQELFSRIPTPLVLHRQGRVIDANAAALALFGHPDLASLLGADLLTAFASGDSRERARRRIEALEDEPPGAALPVTDFKLLVHQRPVSVRATGVRVDAQGGPAQLSIFVDDTERLAAEEAVRRSEALLSHLVATSPDLITLTDLASGRYAMVNHTFERTTGWTAAEVVGRTSLELGVWGSAQAREQFVAAMREQGSVSDLPAVFITKRGTPVSLVVSAARFVMDQREYMVINARDVTEKERERQERAAILANASIGIAVTRERRFVLANRHFEQIYGWPAGALPGQPGSVVWRNEAEYAEFGGQAGPSLARGEAVELECAARRKDGSTFFARVRGRAIDPARPLDSGTVWIVEDITERREFERALARARDDAEAANRAKSAFLANTSHELRTPLNGMIGLAHLAREPGVSEERQRQYLDQIADSAQSLAAIISDILDLSKIEAGKLLIESTVFELGAELRALHAQFAAQAAARGLVLRFEVAPAAAGAVRGDPLRLRQIAANFVANALKFTAQGEVELRAWRPDDGPTLRLAVRDSGPGIDEATQARLFRPFTQADESTTRRFGGSGLGLSICRELAALMGGRVGVESRLGAGSTFWAELPLPVADEAGRSALKVAPATPAGLEGARVLMVEDNPVNMMIAVAMLERWGVKVAQANDGREALVAVQQAVAAGRPFHAVLMDVQMPVMSGHEATRQLRAGEAGRELPIIALTAAALVSEREEALRSGMNDFLTKPIDAERLRATLARWIAGPVPDGP
jgi:PAS domain S-box-containing protein